MTTLRQIITRAARVVGAATAEGQRAPSADDADVAKDLFNDMLREFRGQEIGLKLTRQRDVTAGDVAVPGGLYALNVYTPEEPKNGDRIGVVGARTITATTGDTIEGAASVTTTVSSSWFYREDLADWKLEADVANLSHDHPLSTDCDEALVACLAARWKFDRDGDVPPGMSGQAQRGRGRIRELYGARVLVPVAGALMRGLAHRC